MKTIETVNSPTMKKSASKCKKRESILRGFVCWLLTTEHILVFLSRKTFGFFEENILFFQGKYFVTTGKTMRLLYTMLIPYKRNRRLYWRFIYVKLVKCYLSCKIWLDRSIFALFSWHRANSILLCVQVRYFEKLPKGVMLILIPI